MSVFWRNFKINHSRNFFSIDITSLKTLKYTKIHYTVNLKILIIYRFSYCWQSNKQSRSLVVLGIFSRGWRRDWIVHDSFGTRKMKSLSSRPHYFGGVISQGTNETRSFLLAACAGPWVVWRYARFDNSGEGGDEFMQWKGLNGYIPK